MRSYILTEREREILKHFVETGEKIDGFAVLVHDLRKHRDALNEDLELVEAFLKKEASTKLNEIIDKTLRRAEARKKARLRTRGPYRNARIET